MINLIQQITQVSYPARADRAIQSARVVVSNTTHNSAILDVGAIDFDGNPVYMIDVPFSPQTPPQPQDTVSIARTNSSPYSHFISGGARIGGANSGQVVKVGGLPSGFGNPTARGQILYCEVPGTWVAAIPLVDDDNGVILTEDDDGYIIVMG